MGQFSSAADKAITQAARERLNKPENYATRKDDSGRTTLEPTFSERMVLSGFGNIDASDEMAEVQKRLTQMRNTQKTEQYVSDNVDAHPELKGYDASGGLEGAQKIVQTELDFDRGKQYLEDQGFSIDRLNALTGEKLEPLDPTKRYTTAQLSPYVRAAERELIKIDQEPERKAASERLRVLEEGQKETHRLQGEAQQQQTALAQDRLKLTQWQADQDRKFRQWQSQFTASEKGKDRNQAMDLAMLQFQSNQADRAYRRDADERRDRRDERKERQLMIMQLMKGLQQMGQSFVIQHYAYSTYQEYDILH